MRYYIALTSSTAKLLGKKTPDKLASPKTDLELLSQSLDASLLVQKSDSTKFVDKTLAKFAGNPGIWSFARALTSRFGSNDLIFCPGEEMGIPLSAIFNNQQDRPKIAVWFHRIDGLKGRVALKLFKTAQKVDLFIVSSRSNKNFLRKYLNIPDSQILFLWHPLDCNYFQPGEMSPDKTRPMVVSVGLENRDYCLLAAATEELDVDVKIAGFSQFHQRIAAFPKVMPENMSNKKYQLPELLQLYHDADVVVISLKQNISAAGVTALLEAMACKKPIVCVRTRGLTDYLSDEEAVITVEPGDVSGMQKSIQYLLDNPKEAQLRAERAYQLVWKRHSLEKQVETMVKFMQTSV